MLAGFSLLSEADQLLGLREELKGVAMYEFEPLKAKGEYREPGLQEKSVRVFTGRQLLCGADCNKTPRMWAGFSLLSEADQLLGLREEL